MQTNRKGLFKLRRVTAAFMAILMMLSANATALSAENNESTGKDEQTPETVSSPESETEETEGEITEPTENKETETTAEVDKDQKESAGDEEKTDTDGNPADPKSKEQTESSNTTEKLLAEEIVAEENTEVETAEFSLSEEESEEEDEPETESEEEPEALLLQSKVANTAALNAAGTSGYVFKYSMDKTATDLNSEYETEVTLSLPSAEQKLESFVVFAIDKSSFSDGPQTIQNAIKLLDDIKKSKANVKVNVVIFNRTGHPGEWLDVETQYDEIAKQLKEKQYSGGSNMHAGMLAAKEVLENVRDSQNNVVPDARKYLVLISDGSTYLHCKNDDYSVPYTRSYIPVEKAGGAYAYGGYWVEGYWKPYVSGSDEAGNVRRPKNDDTDSWKEYLADVAKRNDESNGDNYDFVWKYYDASTEEIIKGYIEEPRVLRSASNIDISYLHCYNTWQELNKYNTYSIYVKDNGTTDQSSAIGFMRLLNGGKVAEFDKITDEILYYVSSGSKVEDYMGFKEGDYNFDLADPASMKIEIEQGKGDQKVSNTYTAEKISENKFGFCPNGNGYDFEVEYVPAGKGAKEHFVWYINRNISNFERINLIYKEVLNNPKTVSGTYNVDTNQSATLYPKDSHGNTPNPDHEDFPKPTVSYTVTAPTPSTPTPTPTPRPTSEPTPTSTPTPTYIPVPTIVPTEPTPNPVVPPVVPQQGGNPRPRVVPANQPTPTPTASATPTPRPTPSATPTPTPAVIEEPEVPLARPGAWALINLICSILTCITGLGMGITYLRKHDEAIDEEEEEIRRAYVGDDEEEEEVNKRKASKFTGIIPAVGSVILFCLTEDMRLPMRLVDKWTIWMVLILLVNLLLAYLTRNRNNEKLYFNANGGVGYMEPVIQEAGKDAEVPEGEFVRSGYTFAGWNTEPDGSGDFYQPSDSFRMEKDQVNKLYAQWRA